MSPSPTLSFVGMSNTQIVHILLRHDKQMQKCLKVLEATVKMVDGSPAALHEVDDMKALIILLKWRLNGEDEEL